jgi:MFS family permease
MLPLTIGFLVAGPLSGVLSDRFGARPFATGGMLGTALTFLLLELLPVDFRYWVFALLLLLMGLSMGLFASPNLMGIMNSLPAHRRGVGAGMAATFQNSAMVLSIGIFFSLMIVGLSSSLPGSLDHGLAEQHVPPAEVHRSSELPAVGVLFASFLGYNPMQELLGQETLHEIPSSNAAYLTGPKFFPHLIAQPFADGLHIAFDFAIIACLIAAAASWLRGARYVHDVHAAQAA